MKFTTLNQTTFKDHQGNDIGPESIEFIAPYKHIVDGFYEWECGNCGIKHSDRACGWSISGQVLKCRCGKMNLLVKTNIDELNQWMGKNLTLTELDRQIKEKQEHLDQYVFKSSLKTLTEAHEKYQRAQQEWNIALSNAHDIFLRGKRKPYE